MVDQTTKFSEAPDLLKELERAKVQGAPLTEKPTVETVWAWLSVIPDPEIPVISLTDLGIIRDVAWDGDTLVVTVTPTYSGCPATSIINLDIETALRGHGIEKLTLKRQISPPWTTDWLTDAGRAKLEAYGIAPPRAAGGPQHCPHCKSTRVEKISQFGSTPCKAQWRCTDCLEPFDYFKCI
jgi:ring-1,2-phenylacetyl-CoA epoxidase subunit PaaD